MNPSSTPVTDNPGDKLLSQWLASIGKAGLRIKTHAHPAATDQGINTDTCTAHSCHAFLRADPKPLPDAPEPSAIYELSKRRPGSWQGAGMPLRDGALVLEDLGLVKKGGWYLGKGGPAGTEELVEALLLAGPVLICIDFHAQDNQLKPDGLMTGNGETLIQHTMLATRVNFLKRTVGGVGTQGLGWGDRGTWRCSFETMAFILRQSLVMLKP